MKFCPLFSFIFHPTSEKIRYSRIVFTEGYKLNFAPYCLFFHPVLEKIGTVEAYLLKAIN